MPRPRGLFVSIDGPSGVGKSTAVQLLGKRLTADSVPHRLTAEPSHSEIGQLARAVDRYDGPTLACLYAADRYQHLAEIIRPGVAAGEVVITDRYLPSGLVMQRLDGLALVYLRHLNAHADPPDLAVFLTGDSNRIAHRLHQRGTHNRYQDQEHSTATEVQLYGEAADALTLFAPMLRLDTTHLSPAQVAETIGERIDRLRAEAEPGLRPRDQPTSLPREWERHRLATGSRQRGEGRTAEPPTEGRLAPVVSTLRAAGHTRPYSEDGA